MNCLMILIPEDSDLDKVVMETSSCWWNLSG